MKRNYTFIRRFTAAAILIGGVLVGTTSCVNDEYDFDKELDMNMNLGGTLSIPLGYSVPITLGEMLEDMLESDDDTDSFLESFSDGSYAISMKDNIEVDLSSVSSTTVDPMTIPSGVENFSTAFSSIDFGSFNLDAAGQDIPVSTGLTAVTPSSSTITDNRSVNAGISDKLLALSALIPGNDGSSIQSGLIMSETTVDLGSDVYQAIDLNMSGMSGCPTTVIKVSDITFAEEEASIKLDVSEIAAAFDDTFKMVIPSFEISFPEGFVLDCTDDGVIALDASKRVITATNITLTKDAPSYDIKFSIESYDKTLYNTGGTLDAITGDIICELDDTFTIEGTTNGVMPEDKINISINAAIAIEDMILTVDDIEITVDDQTEIGGTSKIYLGDDDLIKSISSVTLKEENNQNQLSLGINSVSIVNGLSASGNALEVWFPKGNFEITETSDVTYDQVNDVFKLSIPLDDIIISDGSDGGFASTITIEQILFTAPIDGSDQIKLEEEAGENYGQYYIEFTPNISIQGSTIAMSGDVHLSDYNEFAAKYEDEGSQEYVGAQNISTEIKAVNNDGLAIESAEAEISGYQANIDAQTIPISPDETAIDEAISEIYRLDIYSGDVDAPGKVYVTFDIVVDLDLSATGAPVLSFDDYTILLPTFLEFADDLPIVEDKEVEIDGVKVTRDFQKIELTGNFTPAVVDGKNVCQYSAQFEITAIDFTSYEGTVLDENESGEQVLALSDVILLEGGVQIGEGAINSSIIGSEISGSATYTIDEMSISKLSGIVSPEPESGEENIPLDDLSSSLEGDVSIVLTNPTIVITATSSFDIPIQISSLILTTTRNLTEPENEDDEVETEILKTITLSEPILIDPATSGTTTTSIYISSKTTSGTEYDKYVTMEGLENLLASIPDNVVMSYEAGVTTVDGHTHTIDLTRGEDNPYTFEIEYDLNIPLTFDSFSFEYDTTIEGIGGDLEQVLDYVDELNLTLEITSTLPINLSISEIVAIDAEGQVITGLDSFIPEDGCTIAANDTSVIDLAIANNENDDLLLLDGLELSINAFIDYIEGGTSLNADQSIKIKISASIPNGINIDLNDM